MAQGERSGGSEVINGPWGPIPPRPINDGERGGARVGGGPGAPSGEGPPPRVDLAERIARLEAAVEGLRHSQNLTTGAMATVGAILAAVIIGFSVYGLQRVDQTQESISREAAATRQELVGVVTAIANSITAAREMRPPVVVVPAFPPSAPTPSPTPPGK
jgi:hypothetical protein